MLQSNPSFERALPGERPAVSSAHAAPQASPEGDEEHKVPVLGKTLLFRGELTAEEDVILQGRVEGSIRHARNLVIGTDGSVLGDVHASHLTVEGLVEGDLHCSEAVVVRSTAQVRGNIYAPRVGIMEGAMFNGRIEMDPGAAREASQPAPRGPAKQPVVPRAPAAQGASARTGSAATPPRASQGAPAAPAPGTPATSAHGAGGKALASSAVDQLLNAPTADKK
jgi:cytoskeletal protein CcmA (bactofilin family)